MSAAVTVAIDRTQVTLRADRLVWWPEQQTLFVSDTHFGKTPSASQPVTDKNSDLVVADSTRAMLAVLTRAIEQLQPRRLIVLGDWLHAGVRASSDCVSQLSQWRQRHMPLAIWLVMGNHDQRYLKLFAQWAFEVIPQSRILEPFILCHDPLASLAVGGAAASGGVRIGGHVHPGVSTPASKAGNRLSPCFWQGSEFLVLPAFGSDTRLAQVRLAPNQIVHWIADGQLTTSFGA